MEQQISEPSQETKNFIKAVLLSSADPNAMSWFRAGASYMDAISLIILTLQDDDPSLLAIIESITSGQLFDSEIVAKNMLRWEMARPEMDEFVKMNVIGRAANTLLYCRSLVQSAAREQRDVQSTSFSLGRLWVSILWILSWASWVTIKRQIGRLFP